MHGILRLSTVLTLVSLALVSCNQVKAEPTKDANSNLLKVGSSVPLLDGIDQHGVNQSTASNGSQPLVVYFYPKDGTPGCTKEACAFRDVWSRFEQKGVRLLGVSRDDLMSHAKFAEEQRIPFALIADRDGSWAKAFGVPSNNGKSARVSFLFDQAGHLAHVYPNVDPGVHANEVLKDVEALK